MTVSDQCVVVHHYACADEAHYFEGWRDDVLGFREVNGPDYGFGPSITSSGEGWIAVNEVIEDFSLSRLLAEGRTAGTYLIDVVKMFPAPRPATIRIEAELTGEVREVSGVSLRMARVTLEEQVAPGGLTTLLDGLLLIDEGRDVMIVDYDTVTVAGVEQPSVGDLSQIILPGEPGFLSTTAPSCQGLLSLGPRSPEPSNG